MRDKRQIKLDTLDEIFIPDSLNHVESPKNGENPNRHDGNNFFLWSSTCKAFQEIRENKFPNSHSVYMRLTDKAFDIFDASVFTHNIDNSRQQSINVHGQPDNKVRITASGAFNGFVVLWEGDEKEFIDYMFND